MKEIWNMICKFLVFYFRMDQFSNRNSQESDSEQNSIEKSLSGNTGNSLISMNGNQENKIKTLNILIFVFDLIKFLNRFS